MSALKRTLQVGLSRRPDKKERRQRRLFLFYRLHGLAAGAATRRCGERGNRRKCQSDANPDFRRELHD